MSLPSTPSLSASHGSSASGRSSADVVDLADLTTLRVGGPAGRFVRADSEAQIIEEIRAADAAGEPVLVLGGGSNVLVSDAGFDGVVIQDARAQITVDLIDSCGGASFTATAGTVWDDVVVRAVEEGWVGFEALSGIPGLLGAAPIQNIGAYGQELSGVLASVRVYDRVLGRARMLALFELEFGYRSSLLKRTMLLADDDGRRWSPSPRFVVLEVAFQTRLGTLSAPVAYPELARRLGVELGQRAPIDEVRAAVLELRGGKGMVLQPRSITGSQVDHDTWSAGSFFTNPIVSAAAAEGLPDGAPRFPVRSTKPATTTGPSLGEVDQSLVKTSAAWLIEHAGFSKGFGVHGPDSAATLSTKHTLALTNRGSAKSSDLLELARAVRHGVQESFGIELVPEPIIVGAHL